VYYEELNNGVKIRKYMGKHGDNLLISFHRLGAEIGELVHSQDRSGRSLLRKARATQGCSTNRRRKNM
jgi:hypothetical protein